MEYSVGREMQNCSEFYNVPYPQLTNQPIFENVTPGLGQLINHFEVIVPLKGKEPFTVEKEVEVKSEQSSSKDQIGSGQQELSEPIKNSFMHPIVTDSIIFPHAEKNSTNHSRKRKKSFSNEVPEKKVAHKFSVV